MKRYLALILAIAVVLTVITFCPKSFAEEDDEEKLIEAWVICQPDSWVNSRRFPKKNGEINAYLFPGDKVYLDGKQKRGYVHCVRIHSEDGDGWVHNGFIVYSEPIVDGHVHPIVSKGRVACRRYIKGTRRCWVYNEDPVIVHLISDEWCLTNKGFIKTEFIDLATRLDISESTDPSTMTWEDEWDE